VLVLKLETGYVEMLDPTFSSEPSWQVGAQVAATF
jgi:hypothetical protein